jgi:hypothetical protein
MFTAAVKNLPIWSPTLIKFGSSARESAAHGNDCGGFFAWGQAELPWLGAPPTMPSPCDCALEGVVLSLGDPIRLEFKVAPAVARLGVFFTR